MNSVYVDRSAARYLINNRSFQSIEFSDGRAFVSVFKGNKEAKIEGVSVRLQSECVYIWRDSSTASDAIIFDLEKLKDLPRLPDERALVAIQKTLRFATRHWNKLSFAPSERLVRGQKTAFIFPFPFCPNGKNYRLGIERFPDTKREEKRNNNFLYVFTDGESEAQPEIAEDYALFRRTTKRVRQVVVSPEPHVVEASENLTDIKVTELSASELNPINPAIGYEKWQFYLSDVQKSFVNKTFNGVDRLEGPAGSGKTLSLVLRTIFNIKKAIKNNTTLSICFITHSLATKRNIEEIFRSNFPEYEAYCQKSHSGINLSLTTLQDVCLNKLDRTIFSTEYLDRDAYDAKELQKMYLEEAHDEVMANDYDSFKEILSDEFINAWNSTEKSQTIELLQNEIAVIIKGMSDEDIETYKKIIRPKYAIQTNNEYDLDFLYLIYEKYKERLDEIGQFDTDDIVITSLSQFNTPIWRRRRFSEGYDVLVIDETHLFNFNELSIFHHLLKPKKKSIVFSIDIAQAFGDLGLTDSNIYNFLGLQEGEIDNGLHFHTVFRSSSDIINLSNEILSNGATLFTNFTNTLNGYKYSFTDSDESKAIPPFLTKCSTDEECIEVALDHVNKFTTAIGCKKSDVLLCFTDTKLFEKFKQKCLETNKAVEFLLQRGDIDLINKAKTGNKIVAGMVDYVGGLEFDAVIIVGCDVGRVPPSKKNGVGSHHFLSYAWHNKLYVAISRAKYSVEFIVQKPRGVSELLKGPIEKHLIRDKNFFDKIQS